MIAFVASANASYMDREGTTKPFSSLDEVTDLVFAAYVEEDIVAEWAAKNGATGTVLRPHMVMGPSRNSPMNLVTSLATYAAMSRELGLPLCLPGTKEGWKTLQETTDAELFGRATLWALGEDKARNEIFNLSNGDVYRWRQLWRELAAFYDLPMAEPLAMSTVSEMSEKAPLWDSMVAHYGLHATPYNQIANWAFVDWMLNFREETILSTIKIRQAGLRIASTHTRALGGSSPDFATCASSPNGPAWVDAPVCSRQLQEAASENYLCGDLVMKGTASKKRELSKRDSVTSGWPVIRPRSVCDMSGGSHPRRPLEALL